jgi:GT2 family glycosyltransferase
MKEIAIAVVNYGNPKDTLELIDSFSKFWKEDNFDLYITDNFSNDQNFEFLIESLQAEESESSDIYTFAKGFIIRNPANSGFAAGTNLSIRIAIGKDEYQYYWILNNDTLIMEDTELAVSRALTSGLKGIIGSTIIYLDSNRIQCLGGATFKEILLVGSHVGEGLTVEESQKIHPIEKIDYISGAFMLVHREVIEKVGLLEERFFLYFEEIDYCRRASLSGYKLKWDREIKIIHKEGSSINGSRYGRKKSYISEYHSMRSSIIFVLKWHKKDYFFRIAARLFLKTAKNIIHLDFNAIKANFAGFLSALRRN